MTDNQIRHDFDWASQPEPWASIGLRLRAGCKTAAQPRVESAEDLTAKDIKRRRKALGLSQRKLSKAAGCHQGLISEIEALALHLTLGVAAVLAALDRLEREAALLGDVTLGSPNVTAAQSPCLVAEIALNVSQNGRRPSQGGRAEAPLPRKASRR